MPKIWGIFPVFCTEKTVKFFYFFPGGRLVDDFVRIWFEVENAPDERVIDVVRALQESGYMCCLATNQEEHRADSVDPNCCS